MRYEKQITECTIRSDYFNNLNYEFIWYNTKNFL